MDAKKDNIDNRKLTKAEQERKANFEALKERLETQGYREVKLTMSALYANIMTLVVTLPFTIPLLIVYQIYNGELRFGGEGIEESVWWLLSFVVALVLHELIHGITWGIFAENHFKAIAFGFILKYFTPYCNCKEPLKKYEIITGALMPTVFLGLLPAVVGIFLNSGFWFSFGVLMIIGGGGDILCVGKILTYRSDASERLYLDHPYEIGTVIFER